MASDGLSVGSDFELRAHQEWIGLLQPVGLVVSAPALQTAQAFPDKNILKEQKALLALIDPPAEQPSPRPSPNRQAREAGRGGLLPMTRRAPK